MARRSAFVPEWVDEWVYLYARISSDDKKRKTRNGQTREREGIESQLSRMHAECDRRDIPRDRRVEFIDNDVSASRFSTKEREEYAKLVARIALSRGCTVMSVEQSRLVRKEIEGLQFKELMISHGMRLSLLTGEIDLTSESGDLAWTFALFSSKHESEKISRRSRAKFKTDREDLGIHKSARPAFGYVDTAFSVVDEAKAKELHKLRRHIMRGDGRRTGTIGQAHRMLTLDGFINPATGKPYTRNAVTHMLRNAAYAGWVVHDGTKVRKSTHIKPIFTDAEYDALQEKLDVISSEAIKRRGGRMPTGRVHVLSGFLRCGAPGCGARMETASSGHRQRWQCTNGGHTSRSHATVSAAVDAWVRERLTQARVSAVRDAAADPRAVELDRQIKTLESRLAVLTGRYADPADPITDDEYFTLSARLRDAHTALKSERASMEKLAVASLPTDALDVWENTAPETLDTRRRLLAIMVEHVVILPVGNTCGPKPAPLSSVQVYPRGAVVTAELAATADEGLLAS